LSPYQEAMLQNIHNQIELWLESNGPVPHEDVYRFLHSVKGTSGTIGMAGLSELADRLMAQAGDAPREPWGTDELRTFLYPLVRESCECRHNGDVVLATALDDGLDIPADQPLVLILDDDVTLLRYLKDELEANGYFVVATVSPDKAIRCFHDLTPDCFILDLVIPDKNGFEVMETLSDRVRTKFVPTTVISIRSDKETRLRAYRIGADDFMPKPIDMEELLVRLERQLRRKKQLDRLLFVDELTGALNRKCFEESFRRICLEAQRARKSFSLAVIDLDHFKLVNDRYGHLAGDKVLTAFARFVREQTRSADLFFRLGGEEFVMMMPQTGSAEAAKLLERIRLRFAECDPVPDYPELRITFSAGVVEVADPVPESRPCWVEAADSALYRAKELGRDRIVVSEDLEACERGAKRKLNIAVVDDDAIIRAMLIEFLKETVGKRMSVDVRAFKDGQSFLDDPRHAEKGPYLVVLDGMMPGVDGMEALRRLRASEESDRYSVIMLTGRSEEYDIHRALELGADDYLTKPFRVKELEARIRRLTSRMG